jgi:hypothetical protein
MHRILEIQAGAIEVKVVLLKTVDHTCRSKAQAVAQTLLMKLDKSYA